MVTLKFEVGPLSLLNKGIRNVCAEGNLLYIKRRIIGATKPTICKTGHNGLNARSASGRGGYKILQINNPVNTSNVSFS